MIIVAIITIVAPLALLAVFLITSRRFVFDDLRVGENVRRIRQIRQLTLSSSRLVHSPSIAEAMGSLVDYAKSVGPDWIFGVNYGGHILATHVATELKLRDEHVGTIQSYYDDEPELVISSRPNAVEGTALIVDDIARSGVTLERIRQHFLRSNWTNELQLKEIVIATLFIGEDIDPLTTSGAPSWFFCRVEGNNQTFPWTPHSTDLRLAWVDPKGVGAEAVSAWKDLLRNPGRTKVLVGGYLAKLAR